MNNQYPKLTFVGGGEEVTGACYLLETEKTKILVDCGMAQGSRLAEEKNYEPFPFDPKSISALFITHSHIDHIGRVPKLFRDGFRGKIFCTEPVKAFSDIFLRDTGHLIKTEAKNWGVEPFFQEEDIDGALELFQPVEYLSENKLSDDIRFRLRDAGHILGSSVIEIWVKIRQSAEQEKEIKIVFSGDLGNPPTPLLNPTDYPDGGDYLLVESAYGNRLHEPHSERKIKLERAIEDVVTRGGVLLIPAFAMERTQEMLFELNELVENHRIPRMPVFIDSPLAVKATEIYKKFIKYYGTEAKYLIKSGDEIFRFPGLTFTETAEESKKINFVHPPKIIIAGGGMLHGGRILHHAIRYLPDENSMLLIIGYQAAGSLGRRLLDGADEAKIFGETIKVRADIRAIGGYSAHADQKGLLKFVEEMKSGLKKVFVVQGEAASSQALAISIRDHLGIDARSPKIGESVVLE
ncbi:MAG: MBL fold metallo-hydrolase [Patescibacteria group bacterium]